MNTAPNQFRRFWQKVPFELQKNIWLFPIRAEKKSPDVPAGERLKENETYRLSYGDALKRLQTGNNVGIYAIRTGIMFLDLDVEGGNFKASQSILDGLEQTLTIQTRNGGIQQYFLNNENFENQVIRENGVDIGELRTNWFYVVSPGSYVPTDANNKNGTGTYRILYDLPIMPFMGFPGVREGKTEITQQIKDRPATKSFKTTPEGWQKMINEKLKKPGMHERRVRQR